VASKINGIDSAQIASIGAGRAVQSPKDAASGGAGDAGSAAGKDGSQNVQITGSARQLIDLEQQVRDLPAVNETRVSTIRTAIEQGTYTVRPQHVADQLMSLERDLHKLPDPTDSDMDEQPADPRQ
jgi:negative regulator of flagellin synthesis FlgM